VATERYSAIDDGGSRLKAKRQVIFNPKFLWNIVKNFLKVAK
jgi:hypothetical protein